jgi:hypothetical protein
MVNLTGFERSGYGLICIVIIVLARKNSGNPQRNCSQNRPTRGIDLNPGLSEGEAGVVPCLNAAFSEPCPEPLDRSTLDIFL